MDREMEKIKDNNQTGDSTKEGVFFQLFMNSQKSLYAYILSSVHNFNDANDILQETATVLWQNFDKFDRKTNFLAWAISIARNMIRNYFKMRKKSRLQYDDDLVQTIDAVMVDSLDGDNVRIESLKKCYEKLTDSSRQLIKMRYENGMTIKAIASHFGRPLEGMYKYMARLQDSLLQCIEKTAALEK
jgi:RNA polymerase sigma-70 factor, ECF subfamily